jgi:hypothetical protein
VAPQHSMVACILCHGNEEETERAVRSALRFGLPVHVGLTGTDLHLEQMNSVRVHRIPWQDDFAAARNRLLDHVQADFILWLDSDETLFSFPDLDWAKMPGDVYLGRKVIHSGITPAFCPAYIHRNCSRVRWVGPIHEYLQIDGSSDPCEWSPLFSVIIRHHGYEDEDRFAQKCQRNLLISQPGLQSGNPSVEELISVAYWETVSQRFNALSWLACYKRTEYRYADLQLPNGCAYWHIVSAEMLCSCGYTLPAERLLALNPVALRMQFAVLAAQQRMRGHMDRDRLVFVVDCLKNGYFDPYSPFPVKLLGADEDECVAHIDELLREWGDRPGADRDFEEILVNLFEGIFRRIDTFDSDSFEDDILVMHRETRDVLVLNPVAAILWEALRWPQSLKDLVDLLSEAFPSEDPNELRVRVEEFMVALLSRKLILRV